MAAGSPFTSLVIDPAEPREGIDLTVQGSVFWPAACVRASFTIRHFDKQRMVCTELGLMIADEPSAAGSDPQADPVLSAKVLREFPIDDLLTLVRAWIVGDGQPNGPVTQAIADRGESLDDYPAFRAWLADLERHRATVRDSVNGPRVGRKRLRDDAYLRSLAADYIELARTGTAHPRQDLAAKYHKSESGIGSDVDLAKTERWLARPGKGKQGQQRPGERLIAYWAEHGYPDWYPDPLSTSEPKEHDQ